MTYARDKALTLLRLDGLKTQEARDVAFKMYDGPRIEALIREVIEDCARDVEAGPGVTKAEMAFRLRAMAFPVAATLATCCTGLSQECETAGRCLFPLATPSPPRPETARQMRQRLGMPELSQEAQERNLAANLDAPPPRPEGPTCASWCGTDFGHGQPVLAYAAISGDRLFCSERCRDAGRPLRPPHPEKG
jgi:hypothetical protein